MAKIFSKETSPTTRSPEDGRILTFTAYKQTGGKPLSFTAFADTGADQSFIFEDVLDWLGLEMDSSEKPIFKGLGPGQEIRALGKVQISFRLEELGECYNDSFLVLPYQEDFDVILGWPFLEQKMGTGYPTRHRGRVEKVISRLRRV
jgi:Aspartyl protease